MNWNVLWGWDTKQNPFILQMQMVKYINWNLKTIFPSGNKYHFQRIFWDIIKFLCYLFFVLHIYSVFLENTFTQHSLTHLRLIKFSCYFEIKNAQFPIIIKVVLKWILWCLYGTCCVCVCVCLHTLSFYSQWISILGS